MPYIEASQKIAIDEGGMRVVATAGDLNYFITRALIQFWSRDKRYLTICIIIGTLVCAALEFYRRVAVSYEDKKIIDNGDVYS
jgi:hypothetical protein